MPRLLPRLLPCLLPCLLQFSGICMYLSAFNRLLSLLSLLIIGCGYVSIADSTSIPLFLGEKAVLSENRIQLCSTMLHLSVCPNQCPKMSKVIKGSLLGAENNHMWLCDTMRRHKSASGEGAETCRRIQVTKSAAYTSHFTLHRRSHETLTSLSFMPAMSFLTTSRQRSRICSQHKHVRSRESNTVENPVEGPRTRPVRSVLVLANCRVSNQLDPVAFGTPKLDGSCIYTLYTSLYR